ncbi:MAG: hypothetical protein K9J21_06965 [Bacteroidales bacterium]|nr:hypothetical protein [Bacteroidales bacterium]
MTKETQKATKKKKTVQGLHDQDKKRLLNVFETHKKAEQLYIDDYGNIWEKQVQARRYAGKKYKKVHKSEIQ